MASAKQQTPCAVATYRLSAPVVPSPRPDSGSATTAPHCPTSLAPPATSALAPATVPAIGLRRMKPVKERESVDMKPGRRARVPVPSVWRRGGMSDRKRLPSSGMQPAPPCELGRRSWRMPRWRPRWRRRRSACARQRWPRPAAARRVRKIARARAGAPAARTTLGTHLRTLHLHPIPAERHIGHVVLALAPADLAWPSAALVPLLRC